MGWIRRLWSSVAYTYGVSEMTYVERCNCQHAGEYRPSQSDWNAGWTGVCAECGAFYLDMVVITSTR